MSRKSRRETYARLLRAVITDINAQPLDVQHKLMKQWFFVKVTLGIAGTTPLIYVLLSRIGSFLLQPTVVVHPWFNGVSFVALCGIAGLLFVLRERRRYAYGALEIAFALAVIAQAVNQVESQGISAWTAAGAAVYVLVGGLDNLVSGYRSLPPR